MKPGELVSVWFPTPGHLGIGATGYDLADATRLASAAASELKWTIELTQAVPNVRVADLDQNHVLPNMGVIVSRGVWYPNLGPSSNNSLERPR